MPEYLTPEQIARLGLQEAEPKYLSPQETSMLGLEREKPPRPGMAESFLHQAGTLGGLANAPLAAIGAGLSYVVPVREMKGDFTQRFNRGLQELRAQRNRDWQENPVSSFGGSMAGAAATMSVPGASRLLAPASTALGRVSALAPAATGLEAAKQAAGRGAAAFLDAGLVGGTANALGHMDQGATGAGRAFAEAVEPNPANIAGAMVPALGPRLATMAQPLADKFSRGANTVAAGLLDLSKGAAQKLYGRMGSWDAIGGAYRGLRTATGQRYIDLPPETRFAALKADLAAAGEEVGRLRAAADARGVSLDPDRLLGRLREIRAAIPEVIGDVTSVQQAVNVADRYISSVARAVAPRYVPKSTNVSYPAPPQGELGFPKPGPLVPGTDTVTLPPVVSDRPIAVTREGRGAMPGRLLEREAPVELTRGPQGTFSEGGRLPRQSPALERQPPPGERLYADTTRPAPDTGWGLAFEELLPERVGGVTLAQQMSLPSTGRFPARAPVEPVSTNVALERKRIPFSVGENTKTASADEVKYTKSMRPNQVEGMKDTPSERIKIARAKALRAEGEQALQEQAPDLYEPFMEAKGGMSSRAPFVEAIESQAVTSGLPASAGAPHSPRGFATPIAFRVGKSRFGPWALRKLEAAQSRLDARTGVPWDDRFIPFGFSTLSPAYSEE